MFYEQLREKLSKIPIKANFLKDLGLSTTYTGFRYFLQSNKDKPSDIFMKKLCDKLGYEFVVVPVKKNDLEANKEIQKTQDNFFKDIDEYTQKFSKDKGRTYVKEFGGKSVVSEAANAFDEEKEQEILLSDKLIEIDEIFK